MKLDPAALAGQLHVCDGAWASRLLDRGASPEQPVEILNATQPDLVLDIAKGVLDAGAEFLSTNTFGANRLMFERRGCTFDVELVNRRGAQLARDAIGARPVWVVGAMGPSGRILAVRETTPEDLTAVFTEQARALAEGGVDAILLETFSELAEILVALRAVKEATGLPVIASMSFDSGQNRMETNMGAAADACAAALDDAGADVIGCNCGAGIQHVLPAVVAMRGATRKALWVKPSAGLPDLELGRPVYHMTPEEFTAPVPQIIEAGANIIGGCCGIGPEHIRRLAAIVARRRR